MGTEAPWAEDGIWDMGYGIWDIGAEAPRARKIEDRRLELGTNPLHQPNRSLSRTKPLKRDHGMVEL
jgi:hypothetical protein